jgi:hypothetical protein
MLASTTYGNVDSRLAMLIPCGNIDRCVKSRWNWYQTKAFLETYRIIEAHAQLREKLIQH